MAKTSGDPSAPAPAPAARNPSARVPSAAQAPASASASRDPASASASKFKGISTSFSTSFSLSAHQDGVKDWINLENENENQIENFEKLEIFLIKKLVFLIVFDLFDNAKRAKNIGKIFGLAEILSGGNISDLEATANTISLSIHLGYAVVVANLFKRIGTAFAIIAMPLMAGLEVFLGHPDYKIATIATAAISQLAWENREVLIAASASRPNSSPSPTIDEKVAVVWSLFFALPTAVSTTRISIINGLLQLVPLYASEVELTTGLIREMLMLSNKTEQESNAIKSTIIAILEAHLAAQPQEDKQAPPKNPLDHYYPLLLELISSQVESSYDLLAWTVSTLFSKGASQGQSVEKTDFLTSLSACFKAAPALVRYAAALTLSAILEAQPGFIDANPLMYAYIVEGLSDSDFLTQGLYMHILGLLNIGLDAPNVREPSYDERFMAIGSEDTRCDEARVAMMEAVVNKAGPLRVNEMHKLANSLEFVERRVKMRQLRLIRVWGRKTLKLDIYLLKILIPLCGSNDAEIQSEAIKVAEKMLPSFSQAPAVEIMYIWSYISSLLLPSNDDATLEAALRLLPSFPLQQLSDAAKEEAMSLLFSLSFHPSREIRAMLYKFLGSMGDLWRNINNTNTVLAQLLISMGDDHPANVNLVIDQLLNLSAVALGPAAAFLAKLRDHPKKSCADQLRMYESLSSFLLLNKLDLRPIIECMVFPACVDEVWSFYLNGVPENQLVRPEEYNYGRNGILNPMWPALLFSKFSVPPPPLGEGVRRDAIPSNPIGKRRFICGFMQCLLPTMGNYDPMLRKPATLAALLCCFKGPTGGSEILKGLLEFVTQHLLPSKYVTFQVSAIEILRGICRCKIPGLSESIFTQYLDICFEFLHNSPSHIIQVAILEFMEVFCLVFPKGIQTKLQEILDVTRPFLGDQHPEVAEAASKLYPLIFKCAPDSLTPVFEEYLRREMIMLTNEESIESLADPLISHLKVEDALRILELNVVAVGLLLDAPGRAFENAQFLINFINHESASFRLAALNSILNLTASMTTAEISMIVWILLPLFGDLNASIRLAWSKFRRNLPTYMHARINALSAHPDDRASFPLTTWEELLNEHPTVPVQAKALVDMTWSIDDLIPPQQNDFPIEDDGFHFPTISENLMSRFKQIVASMAGPLLVNDQNLVLYQLEQYRDNPSLVPPMNMVLSEFACLHDDVFESTAAVLIGQLAVEMDSAQAPSIESSIVGIRNILVHSNTMVKPIIESLVEQQFLAGGELLVMVHCFDMFVNITPETAFDLISKFCLIGNNIKHSDEKRILALYLASEFATIVGPEFVKPVLDALEQYLDSQPSGTTREKLYKMAGKIFSISGDKHMLFKSMLVVARKLLKSNLAAQRIQALSIIRIFAPTMQPDECFSFMFRFLSDPAREIREATRDAIIEDQLLSKYWTAFKNIDVESPEREALLTAGKLPCMEIIGLSAISTPDDSNELAVDSKGMIMQEGTAPVKLDDDPFNINYYRSDQRKKFTQHYQLDEGKFSKCMEPSTMSILKSIENKVNGVTAQAEKRNVENEMLRNIQPLGILRALIPFSPTVAESIVLDLLRAIEIFVDSKKLKDIDEESKDLEGAIHKIEMLSNFMVAYGTSRPDLTEGWLDRIQKFVSSAMQLIFKLRNSLYADMEKSFYYHNQYADIPLISEEQIQALQDLREVTQEAILDIVKSGKTEKVKLIDNRNDQWDGDVDDQSDYLRTLTFISLQVLSGYGIYFILTKDATDQALCDAFKFIIAQLEEEHRGIRYLAVESAVEMILRQESLSSKPLLKQLVLDTVGSFVLRLQNESGNMYRKKTDYIYLAAQLVHLFEDPTLQNQLLQQLVRMWTDGDSEVRHFSVDLIPILAERGVKPVIESFKDKAARAQGVTSVDLVQELVVLGNNPDYPDKHLLQNLLRWRFSDSNKIWVSA